MNYFSFTMILLCFAFAKAQPSQAPVSLIEEKLEKRWNLYAQNNTDQGQEAFLLVQGEGFRHSADRPVIKKIPPNAKVLMITLIPLAGATPTYKTIFTFETNLSAINKRKGENKEEYVNIRPLQHNELTLFIEDDCEKCNYLVSYLNRNRIKFRKLNVKKNKNVFNFMWKHLKGKIPTSDVVKLPVVMQNQKVYHDIENIKRFITTYNWDTP